MTKVGDKVWVFDQNHRVYPKKPNGSPLGGGPIYREHFREREITGETSRSWVLSSGLKVPKTGGDVRGAVYMTRQAVEDAVFMNAHRWRIEEAVGRVLDATLLRQIAALVGYKAEP